MSGCVPLLGVWGFACCPGPVYEARRGGTCGSAVRRLHVGRGTTSGCAGCDMAPDPVVVGQRQRTARDLSNRRRAAAVSLASGYARERVHGEVDDSPP